MKSYEVNLYSCDETLDQDGNMNAQLFVLKKTTSSILNLLDDVKKFISDSKMTHHSLSIEIDQV